MGKIVAVNPPPGTELNTQSQVTVHLSLGPAPANVPSVYDVESDQARSLLEQAGFKVKVEKRYDDTIRGNHAIGTEPEAGTTLTKGSEVTLLISTAAQVPDLSGLTETEARSQLAAAGIRVDSVVRSTDSDAIGAKANEVYITDPPAGTLLDASDTTVTIELVGYVEVPSVIGKKVSDARQILQDAGLKADIPSSASADSRVYAQSPGRFDTVEPGTEIELRVLG